jgi:serine phosphatase RsbU (regulator of sigma subunit)
MEIFILKGKTEEAFKEKEIYFRLRDSLSDINVNKEIAKQMTVYQLEKKELEKQKLIAEKKQQQYFIIGTTISSVILLALILVVLKSYQQKKRANIELERKNNIIEVQKKLVEDQNKNITDSIHYASRIQSTLLPSQSYLATHLSKFLRDFFILYIPKDIVSGDFYWATQKDNFFYFVVGDSTGHGVPGAFMSLLNINFLNEAITEKGILETGQIFDYVKSQLVLHLHGE